MDAKGAAAWLPGQRDRVVSPALQAYAALTTNAARGAVRDVTQVQGARTIRARRPAALSSSASS